MSSLCHEGSAICSSPEDHRSSQKFCRNASAREVLWRSKQLKQAILYLNKYLVVFLEDTSFTADNENRGTEVRTNNLRELTKSRQCFQVHFYFSIREIKVLNLFFEVASIENVTVLVLNGIHS